jgi:hypothetical protein
LTLHRNIGHFLIMSPHAPRQAQFRKLLLAFSCVLAIAGIWNLMAEAARPSAIKFPGDGILQDAANTRRQAALAARLAVVRGDLWAESFFSYSDLTAAQNGKALEPSTMLHEDLPEGLRALSYAPHRSDVWLLLADLVVRYRMERPSAGAALKMSYYTGSHAPSLTALRLTIAFRSDALDDADVQRFVEGDLRTILGRKPELRPTIVQAYALASAEGRQLIERVTQETDPSFITSLRKPGL